MSVDTYGLVLAGGGAKGAYQVGALRYLCEIGLSPRQIAGTSIGALNGAVLASERTFAAGVDRLDELWQKLGREHVLQIQSNVAERALLHGIYTFVPILRSKVAALLPAWTQKELAVFDSEPVERLLRSAIDPAAIRCGPDLWVAVFRSLDIPLLNVAALGDLLRAASGANAEWFRVRDFNDEEMSEVLLASAAIPLAFPRREVRGHKYVDGGLADNVPVGPLVRAGCDRIVVIHLGNGQTWSRHGFPEHTVIEIRPELSIQSSEALLTGWINALLDFSPERIDELKQRGYEDAQRCLKSITTAIEATRHEEKTRESLIASTQDVLNDRSLA